ncbi:MAG: DUF3006 domain-containing protein [Ruminococcaceae bacterium]|jgi:hypothetical protein|nr:DUF3006 domain-containing protein [Oscillospiraceae bacterium]
MIIVDRIEEDIAVVYFGDEKVNIPISELPEGIHEGTVLKRTPDGLTPDPEAEEARRRQIADKVHRLFK